MTCSALAAHPYRGLWAAIATMHGKERVIAPHLCKWFDMAITTAPGIDTDALGTFTGEIARQGTMLDAARAKAKLAIERTGAPLGIGSEGSFGPDPNLPFIAAGHEVLLLREAASGHQVIVSRRTATNFDHVVVGPDDAVDPFLERIGFPQHAVVVHPEPLGNGTIVKGVSTRCVLERALGKAWQSASRAMIRTDMRAHLNPTRIASIARGAKWLALKSARCCPSCGKPGFGCVDIERGLLCAACGSPTRLVRAEVHGCISCGHRVKRRIRNATVRSDPSWCDFCNP